MPNVYIPAQKKQGRCENCYGPIQGSAAKRFCSTYCRVRSWRKGKKTEKPVQARPSDPAN